MTKLEKLQAEFRTVEAKAKPLHDKDELTEAEGAEYQGLIDQMEALKAKIDQENRVLAAFSSAPNQERIEVVTDSADQPWDGSTPAERVGSMLQAIARAKMPAGNSVGGRPTGIVDRRLYGAASGMNEAVPSEGGFAVGTDFSTTVLQRVYDPARLPGMCNRIPVSTNASGVSIPCIDESSRADGSRLGGVQAYWVAEAGSATAKKPKLGLFERKLEKIMAIGYATDELLQDAAQLGTVMVNAFTSEIMFKVQDGIVRGDGVGKILGYLEAPCLVSVAAEGGQAADTINGKNVLKMYAANPYRDSAVWVTNSECIPQLAQLSIPMGAGAAPIWLPAGGIAGRTYDTMFGRPVLYLEQASALGDLGDISFIYLPEFVLIDKGGIQTAQSMHLNFTTDEMAYRLVYRVNGAPAWSSDLTPFKGAQHLSPFVTLAAR